MIHYAFQLSANWNNCDGPSSGMFIIRTHNHLAVDLVALPGLNGAQPRPTDGRTIFYVVEGDLSICPRSSALLRIYPVVPTISQNERRGGLTENGRKDSRGSMGDEGGGKVDGKKGITTPSTLEYGFSSRCCDLHWGIVASCDLFSSETAASGCIHSSERQSPRVFSRRLSYILTRLQLHRSNIRRRRLALDPYIFGK